MPGAGASTSPVVRAVGAIVALVAAAGFLVFGWSFDSAGDSIPTVIGIAVAALAIGWTLYSRVFSDGDL